MKDSYYIEFLEYMASYIDEQRLEKISKILVKAKVEVKELYYLVKKIYQNI